jgi:replication fork clamp-binding protein CrfC
MEVWKLNYGEEKAEWEKRLEEYLKPIDEIERIEMELKEYGVEQRKPEKGLGNPERKAPAEKVEELWRRIGGYIAGIRLELERIESPFRERNIRAVRDRAEHIRDEYVIPLLEALAALEAIEDPQKAEGESGNPIIPAVDWRKLSNMDILGSIEVALRVLRERKLSAEEKKYAATLAKDLIDVASDPIEGNPDREEEEYEEVRRRARAVRGPKLFPV